MKLVYVAHQIGGNIEENLKDLSRILRILNLKYDDIAFFAPYYADITALDDSIPEERDRGIRNNTALIKTGVFDELWLTGDKFSHGMKCEAKLFTDLGKPIIDKIGHY